MSILITAFTVVLLLVAPFFLKRASARLPLVNDVVLCFLIGGILSHTQHWWLPSQTLQEQSHQIGQGLLAASVIFAIPLLLLSSDVSILKQQLGRYLFSFLLCLGSAIVAALLAAYYFRGLPDLATATGGLLGVYVGGTPNLVAVLYAMKAPPSLFVTLNATDAFCSGLYFLALISIAKTVYGWVLPKKNTPIVEQEPTKELLDDTLSPDVAVVQEQPVQWDKAAWRSLLQAVGLTLVCIALSVVLALFVLPNPQGELNELALILTLSTASIGLAFVRGFSFGEPVYEAGQYLLLVFAFALGYLVDFSVLLETGTTYLAFNTILLVLLLVLHLVVARLFKIDVDLFIITSTACIMGPPFIGPVCRALNNKTILAPGMALSLLGLMIGTYLGIGVALYLPF